MDHPAANDGGPVSLAILIAGVAAGNEAAFRQIYDRRASRLFGIAYRITRQVPMASDAVQDAFLELWRNANRFDQQRGDPDVWLSSLVRYRALDMTRRVGREVSDEDLPEEMDTDPDPLERLVAADEASALGRCLGALPPERRKLLSLAYLDGLSHTQLAARLQMPVGSVKSVLRRGLLSLRVCMEGEL